MESSTLSTIICRTKRERDAPSAERTAISRSRREARASSRFATLPQAISSTKPTAARRVSNIGRTFFTTSNSSGTTRMRMPDSLCISFSLRNCSAMRSISACAWGQVTPGFSRPNTLRKVKLRGNAE